MPADYSGMDDLKKYYMKVSKDFHKFLEDFLFEQAMRALRKIKLRTPVDTGALRNAWTVENGVVRKGNTLIVVIKNPLEYASFIEYGHTKQNRIGWVDGYFMATVSIQEVQDALPRRFDKAFNDFLLKVNKKEGI